MVLADGFIAHTNHTGDVSHVTSRSGASDYRWIDPTKF
jgi:hypothetical protein